jgi:hypothetical protein
LKKYTFPSIKPKQFLARERKIHNPAVLDKKACIAFCQKEQKSTALNVAVVLLGQCRPTDAWALLLAFSHWAARFQGWAMSMFFPLRLMVKIRGEKKTGKPIKPRKPEKK